MTPGHGEIGDAEVGRLFIQNSTPMVLLGFGTGIGALFILVAVFLEASNPWAAPVFFALVASAYCFTPSDVMWRTLGRGVTLCRDLGHVGVRGLREPSSGRRSLPEARSAITAPLTAYREKQAERQLLKAIERCGEVTVVQAALETTLSVSEVDRMLFNLATRGHLRVKVEGERILYSL